MGHNKLIIVDTDDELRLQFEAISGLTSRKNRLSEKFWMA